MKKQIYHSGYTELENVSKVKTQLNILNGGWNFKNDKKMVKKISSSNKVTSILCR